MNPGQQDQEQRPEPARPEGKKAPALPAWWKVAAPEPGPDKRQAPPTAPPPDSAEGV